VEVSAPPRAGAFATRAGDHRFFTVMSLVVSAVIVVGFGATYGARLRAGPGAVPTVIHLHAAAFTAWLALFVAQAVLAARGRLCAHRRLGFAGLLLAVVMLVLGVAAALSAGRLGHRGLEGAEFRTPAGFTLFSLLAVLAFFTLALAALWLRDSPQAHKRLMLLALTGALLPPGLSRVPGLSSRVEWLAALSVAFLLAGPLYDLLTRRRLHPAYLWGAPPIVLTLPPLVARLAETDAWQRFFVALVDRGL
jgi:hypothetical protein